ncbi:UNVERIFIED_CONTAM: hypothetical protein PYX00_000916 [Menopon gallinae]|uniref:RecQ-like DNA helicase BLM n=1 Tax=Menopon gallinae TaxID=328185 RepID=A0AAW2IAY4_9NEOP
MKTEMNDSVAPNRESDVCDFDLLDEDFVCGPEDDLERRACSPSFMEVTENYKMDPDDECVKLSDNFGDEDVSVNKEGKLSRFIEEAGSLGMDDEIDTWLDETLQNEAFSFVGPDVSKSVLEKNLNFLRNSYTELLEKVMNSFEKIPTDLLKCFRGFDPDVFIKLRTTIKRTKAVMIKTNNTLKRNYSNASNSEGDSDKKSVFSQNLENSFRNDSGDRSVCVLSGGNEIGGCKNYESDKSVVPVSEQAETSYIDLTSAIYKSPAKDKSQAGDKFQSNMRNDGATGEFEGFNFPHSQQIQKTLRQEFGLKSFRPNQLQVINAALLGYDCFVLMPTGGGKSLCYQLPAIISKGVTVIVSPLRSLILDQVTKLLTLDIPAAHLSGDLTDTEASHVYSKLNQREPPIKLLYVTPEKVGSSNMLRSCLTGLYQRGMLARFVIDEVHCVSQWGHDFRPDYKRLKELREKYPKVQIMALTATATPRVRTDILHQLKMGNPKWFLSSFNRSNLVYSVRDKKGKSVIKEIAELIQKEYKKETGVIYCFSRKECEDVAKELKMYGVDAVAYHAGLDDNARTRVQNQWMNDKVKVVCATIAFGMGVDKLDVRFVIHYSLPKSIEGYYQESGRAGRDGGKATCILYYAHKDKLRVLKLINMDQSIATQQARKVHIDNLFRVVAFAENKTDCRRALQLEYLGEKFDRSLCLENRSTACDNCLQQGLYNTIDVTDVSKAIVSAVKSICGLKNNYTMLHFVDVFKGATAKKVVAEGHDKIPLYGMGKTWIRLDIERLFRKLIMDEYLKEHLMVKDEGITFAYLKVGRRAEELLGGSVKIQFDVRKANVKKSGSTASMSSKTTVNPAVLEIQENCYAVLMDVIKGIASALNCNANAIMNIQAIRLMSQNLPETAEEMLSINHVTKANFEKYGEALLDVTKNFAEQKREVMKKMEKPPPQPAESKPLWPEMDSHYFETEVDFIGSGAKMGGKKRKRRNNGQKWQYAKKPKNSFGGKSTSSGAGRGRGKKNPTNDGSGVVTFPLGKYSRLMELPTVKTSSAPRSHLKNL